MSYESGELVQSMIGQELTKSKITQYVPEVNEFNNALREIEMVTKAPLAFTEYLKVLKNANIRQEKVQSIKGGFMTTVDQFIGNELIVFLKKYKIPRAGNTPEVNALRYELAQRLVKQKQVFEL